MGDCCAWNDTLGIFYCRKRIKKIICSRRSAGIREKCRSIWSGIIIPRLLAENCFIQVQYMHPLGKREDAGSGNTRRRYPYSGRIVCTHCGRFYHTRNRNSRPIWYCPVSALGNGRSLCHSHWIYEEELTKALDRAARRHFQNPEMRLRFSKRC